jgi:hypothetical protein
VAINMAGGNAAIGGSDAASRAAGAVAVLGKDHMAPVATPAVVPQITVQIVPQGDAASAVRGQPALTMLPQHTVDGVPSSSATAPQSESAPSRSTGGATSGEDSTSTRGPDGARPTAPNRSAQTALTSNSANASVDSEPVAVVMDVSRAALLQSMSFNVHAVDEALAVLVDEVEHLGGAWAAWLTDGSVPPWTIVATAAAAFGAGYAWRARGRRLTGDRDEEESSSWLFIQLQTPAGQL